MAGTIPGPPRQDVTITRGSDMILNVSRTAAGVPAPFDAGARAYIRLGERDDITEHDCQIVDGVIIMRIESEVLDLVKRGTSYVLLTSLPTEPDSTETAHLVGKLVRE